MQFGLFGSANVRRDEAGGQPGQGYFDFVEANVVAERLGFHSTFLVEHHFTGVGQVSASLSLLTWLAARTEKLRLGTAVIVLPWHNPVLLAEQAATLDLLSGGRLDFGVGRGYRYPEFHGFDLPMDQATERFEESLEVIQKAWTSDERFSHRGQFWSFNDIMVEPPACQKPHPPIWIAAGSQASVRKVATRGCNLLLDQFATPDVIEAHIAIYREELEARGGEFSPERVAVARYACVSEDASEVQDAYERLLSSNQWMVEQSRAPDGQGASHILRYTDRAGGPVASAMYGTSDEVSEQVQALRDIGVEYVLLSTNDGGRTMQNFGERVLPRFA